MDWLSASVDEYSGLLFSGAAGGNLRLSDHFSVGLEYRTLILDGDIESDNWKGGFDSDYSGPALILDVYW